MGNHPLLLTGSSVMFVIEVTNLIYPQRQLIYIPFAKFINKSLKSVINTPHFIFHFTQFPS